MLLSTSAMTHSLTLSVRCAAGRRDRKDDRRGAPGGQRPPSCSILCVHSWCGKMLSPIHGKLLSAIHLQGHSVLLSCTSNP